VRIAVFVIEALCVAVWVPAYLLMTHASSTALQLVGAFVASIAGLCWLTLVVVDLAVRLHRWLSTD
jgi:threonine/homoserine efflux transporter RhtA